MLELRETARYDIGTREEGVRIYASVGCFACIYTPAGGLVFGIPASLFLSVFSIFLLKIRLGQHVNGSWTNECSVALAAASL